MECFRNFLRERLKKTAYIPREEYIHIFYNRITQNPAVVALDIFASTFNGPPAGIEYLYKIIDKICKNLLRPFIVYAILGK